MFGVEIINSDNVHYNEGWVDACAAVIGLLSQSSREIRIQEMQTPADISGLFLG